MAIIKAAPVQHKLVYNSIQLPLVCKDKVVESPLFVLCQST